MKSSVALASFILLITACSHSTSPEDVLNFKAKPTAPGLPPHSLPKEQLKAFWSKAPLPADQINEIHYTRPYGPATVTTHYEFSFRPGQAGQLQVNEIDTMQYGTCGLDSDSVVYTWIAVTDAGGELFSVPVKAKNSYHSPDAFQVNKGQLYIFAVDFNSVDPSACSEYKLDYSVQEAP